MLSLADASPAAAVRILTGALDLRRGLAYAGIERAFARTEAQRLDELRLRCVELLADVHLTLREHTTAAACSSRWSPPVRRGAAASRLMLALYRDDRPADALAVFRRVRHVLVDELGIEPCPVLREVERRSISAARCSGGPAPGCPTGSRRRWAASSGARRTSSGSATWCAGTGS